MLVHGADLLAQDDHGLTALDIAEQAEHEPCMKVLKESAGKVLLGYFVTVFVERFLLIQSVIW